MSKDDLIAWRTIVQVLKLTGYYWLYEEEITKIAKLLRSIGSDKK